MVSALLAGCRLRQPVCLRLRAKAPGSARPSAPHEPPPPARRLTTCLPRDAGMLEPSMVRRSRLARHPDLSRQSARRAGSRRPASDRPFHHWTGIPDRCLPAFGRSRRSECSSTLASDYSSRAPTLTAPTRIPSDPRRRVGRRCTARPASGPVMRAPERMFPSKHGVPRARHDGPTVCGHPGSP